MPERLLIVGGGLEQVRAYEIAGRMGLQVVGTDVDPRAPALRLADDRLICSTRDVEQTLRVVSEYALRKPIDGVMTIANDVPQTVAAVAGRLGLPGIPDEAARNVSDKLRMKRCFDEAGVPTPAHREVATLGELLQAAQALGPPVILKPSDGRGSRGVLFLDAAADLGHAWRTSFAHSGDGRLLVESFVPGPQLSVEGMFVDGRYVAVAFADRNYDNLETTRPHVVEDGGVIPSRYEESVLRPLQRVIEDGARALGIEWGSVKADIVLGERGPQIIELAGRLSGNYLATHHIPMAYGVDLVSCVIDLALGRTVEALRLQPTRRAYLGVRYFFPPAGRVVEVAGVEEVRRLPYVKMLTIQRRAGDLQPTIESHVGRAGTIICEAPDYRTAFRRVERARTKIRFVVEELGEPRLAPVAEETLP